MNRFNQAEYRIASLFSFVIGSLQLVIYL